MGRISPWRRGIEWGIVVLILAFLAAVIWPIYKSAAPASKAAACLSNEKQLGIAAIMYANDHDNRFMPRDTWMDVIEPYSRNTEIERCPGIEREKGDQGQIYGYGFNSRLSIKDPESLGKPEELPLLYDSINLAKNASDPVTSLPNPPRLHGKTRRNNMGFADGHAKSLYPKGD